MLIKCIIMERKKKCAKIVRLKCIIQLPFASQVNCINFGSFGNDPMQSCSVLSCGGGVVIIGSIGICVQPSQWQLWLYKLHILQIYAAIALVYAPEIFCQCDVYFLNGSHFSRFIYVVPLSTWFNLKPLYLAQLCICTGASHKEEIKHLLIIFLKLWIWKKSHILHFLAHLAFMPKI